MTVQDTPATPLFFSELLKRTEEITQKMEESTWKPQIK